MSKNSNSHMPLYQKKYINIFDEKQKKHSRRKKTE